MPNDRLTRLRWHTINELRVQATEVATEALAAAQRKLTHTAAARAATGPAAHARRRDYTDADPVVG